MSDKYLENITLSPKQIILLSQQLSVCVRAKNDWTYMITLYLD